MEEKIKSENNFENNVNQQNGNSEIKPKNKKLTIVLVALIILLILAIGVCAGLWLAGDTTKVINKSEEKVHENQDKELEKEEVKVDKKDNAEENKIEEEKTQQNNSKKIDETKPWVYDADYNKETKIIYETSDKKNSITSDECLKVPFININSDDAQKANLEIKKLYDQWYMDFGKVWEESSGWKSYQQYFTRYDFSVKNNILSIVIKQNDGVYVVDGDIEGETRTLYTFNFNLETLDFATLDEIAKVCGFNSANEVTNKITAWENNQYYMAMDDSNVVNSIFQGVTEGKYFIDINGKLNFVYKFSAGTNGEIFEIVEPDKEIEDFYEISNTDSNDIVVSNEQYGKDMQYMQEYTEKFYKLLSLKEENPNLMLTELNLIVQSVEVAGDKYIEHPDKYMWTGIKYSEFRNAMWFVTDELLERNYYFSEFCEYEGYLYIVPNDSNKVNYRILPVKIQYEDDLHTAYFETYVVESKDGVYVGEKYTTIQFIRGNGDYIKNSISLG